MPRPCARRSATGTIRSAGRSSPASAAPGISDMCRILGYVGPRVALPSLLSAPPHSLEHQAGAPRLQAEGRINADGWGVSWYDPDIDEAPARYRTSTPMWADSRFRDMGRFISSD